MQEPEPPVIYQIKVALLGISPMIWRRLLVCSDSSIANLHHIIQIAMGWTDTHLHRFIIHGKQYGISQPGGLWFSDDPNQVKLSNFRFRVKEHFLYEYDFGDRWQHQIRVEAILTPHPNRFYPVCIAGKRACPPEDCGGAWAFMEKKQEYWVGHIAERLSEIIEDEDIRDDIEEIYELRRWLIVDNFDRHQVNHRLKQYAIGDDEWMFS